MSSTRLFLWKLRWPQSWPITKNCDEGRRQGRIVRTTCQASRNENEPPTICQSDAECTSHRPCAQVRCTHAGECRARQRPRERQQVPGADADEVQADRHRRDAGQHSAPGLPVVQLKDLQNFTWASLEHQSLQSAVFNRWATASSIDKRLSMNRHTYATSPPSKSAGL